MLLRRISVDKFLYSLLSVISSLQENNDCDFMLIIIMINLIYGTVSAKIAPRLKCYKNASRLNRYTFPTDNAIDFLFSILHTTPFLYEVLKIGSR